MADVVKYHSRISMIKNFALPGLLAFLFVQTAFAQAQFHYKDDFQKILARTKNSDDELFYDKLLKRFSINDPTLTAFEVLSLLIGFTDKPEFRPYHDLEKERAVYRANVNGKFRQALDSANTFLRTHPVSVKVLFEKANSFRKLGHEDSAAYYVLKGRGIFEAMNLSGNGKSVETPTFALGPADGQEFIYKYVGPRIGGAKIGTMGSGKDKNGNFLDILEVVPRNGSKPYNLYFIIQHAKDKMFAEEEKK